jgi:hypothetical protein
MNWRDVKIGMTVYHVIYTHWGPGTVMYVSSCDCLESMFERGNRRVVVRWESICKTHREQLRSLRMTPNRKKILAMVELYHHRGFVAKDGGDRLILPTKKPHL